MTNPEIINWLLEGDVSIQYQVFRDLLDENRPDLQERIQHEGWGRLLLSKRQPNGHWGQGYYQPKWISTHYTLLDLKNLGLSPDVPTVRETIELVLNTEKSCDGGIYPIGTERKSDVCVSAMFFNFACWFKADAQKLESVADFLLDQQLPDGGFNCHSNRLGCVHSSLHTTISVLEGLLEYAKNGYTYRINELMYAVEGAREFVLMHRLYKSDKTGAIIHPNMTKLPYPSRWYYDILRALDYFQAAGLPRDSRMNDALELLQNKRRPSGKWPLQGKHPGKFHIEMEQAGKESRWNTLRALRVLKWMER